MKLNLVKDRAKLRSYIESRIRDYPIYENLGPGEDEDAIRLLTVGYYAEQGGYVNVVFDTRPKADVDGEWTLHIDGDANTCPFPKWTSAYESLYDGEPLQVTRHDGTSCELSEADGDEAINRVFGEMILEVLKEMRDDGAFKKLPLAPGAFMVIEEFDGRYSWPPRKTRKSAGRMA